ncbi:MAG: hypothetical protein JSS81_01890 [Acidobacteria bacterium]|nr:hypothetical protein [Acidobacteriota bacterium]
MGKLTGKIPSFLWIPLIVGAVALSIGAIWIFFYGIGYVEGFGSLILLVLGWIGFRIGNRSDGIESRGFAVALGITFFAMMGMALDQPGNFIYNRPLEWLFCPPDAELVRETIRRGLRGGGVSLTQDFACVARGTEQVVRQISGFEHFGIRFLEYVALGYLLLALSRLFTRLKSAAGGNV